MGLKSVHFSFIISVKIIIFAPNFRGQMKIKEIIAALERFAPLPLQDGFDNAGLQIGLTEAEATGALLCLDVTEAVVDEAVTLGYNLIVSHHPLIFKGYKSITGRDYIERCILKAIRNDIVIYSAHTNLDNAPGGVNYKIAEKIGLTKLVKPFCVCCLPIPAEIRVQVSLAYAVCVNIDVHVSCPVFFIDLLKASQKLGSVIFLKSVGTQVFQNSLIAFGNPVEG